MEEVKVLHNKRLKDLSSEGAVVSAMSGDLVSLG